MDKVGRGQKLCKNCNTINGVRAFNCKSCGTPFTMKKPRKNIPVGNKSSQNARGLVLDYKELSKGDVIKVLKGSGPYYTDENGEKTYLGNKGKYKVDSVMDDGIMIVNDYGSHEFLYMGPVVPSTMLDTLTRAPHKVVLLKKAPTDVAVDG